VTIMPDGGYITMVLADRHALFRQALRARLELERDLIVVEEARTAPEAVATVEARAPQVAIVDMDLPPTGGTRATALIKDRMPACHVLAVGSGNGHAHLIEVLEAGATGYLTKEAPLARLIDSARRVAHGETVVPPDMLGPLVMTLLRRKKERERALGRLAHLTAREREVLGLLADGADNGGIAHILVISPQTARTHIQNVLGKLGVHSRLEAAAFVTRSGVLPDLLAATG
jgi:DNA-binding NarL/FixJ family response regulator